jgi:hypothetical protein
VPDSPRRVRSPRRAGPPRVVATARFACGPGRWRRACGRLLTPAAPAGGRG